MDYVLEKEFEYAVKGEVVKASFISLSEPTPRNIPNLAPVKSEVLKAVHWAQTKDDTDSEDADEVATEGKVVSSSAMMTTLELADGIDVSKVLLHVKEMLVEGRLAQVDGENKFTASLYESLSIKDVYGITGAFIANFILPSL